MTWICIGVGGVIIWASIATGLWFGIILGVWFAFVGLIGSGKW